MVPSTGLAPARAAVLLLLLLALPARAAAHAIVLEASPSQDAVLTRPPERVMLRFNSKIEKRLSRVTLGPRDEIPVPVALAQDGAGAQAPDRLIIPLQPLAPGRYILRYRVLAVDGHITEGVLRFTVGSGQ